MIGPSLPPSLSADGTPDPEFAPPGLVQVKDGQLLLNFLFLALKKSPHIIPIIMYLLYHSKQHFSKQ